MNEMVGLKLSYDGDKLTTDEAIDYMVHPETITKGTPSFSLTSFEIENDKIILYTMGYSGHLMSLDLDNEYILNAYKITNREHIFGYYYVYRGYVDNFSYSEPLVTSEENHRGNLIMRTTPIIPYRVTVLYKDGSTYTFNYRSTNTSLWGCGVHKSLASGFNGKFYVGNKFKMTGQGYEIYSPY